MTPNDPLYPEQWHFPLLGDIETIWDEYTGSGVTAVAVYDDGLQFTHPDLAANYDRSLEFRYQGEVFPPIPITDHDDHGTSVAGLIAAVGNNGLGGVGVAFDATLSGINLLRDPVIGINNEDSDDWVEALLHAAAFDVMNNSWGATPQFLESESLLAPDSDDARTVAAYAEIMAEGRDGLGTVILQAAGNDTMNANGEGVNAARFTATIAAVDGNGDAEWYTNYGANVLVSAPAGSVTTTLVERGEFTDDFGGTSAATPVTSGVVALMLDAAPGLGWRDVHDILAASAQLTGSDFDAPARNHEIEPWFSNDAETWNGGGAAFNLSYGYGRVDAFAAVRMAEVWLTMKGEAATSANEVSAEAVYEGAPVRVRENGQATVSVDLDADIAIENVSVTVGYRAESFSDLKLTLVSPDGTEVPLLLADIPWDFERFSRTDRLDWEFGVTALRGLEGGGTWQLVVEDLAGGGGGVLDSLALEVFGAPATADDVHHFTHDFPQLAAAEPDRRRIEDADGGTDWINLAAIAAPLVVDLADGGTIAAAGKTQVRLVDGEAIENAVTGDGDDRLFGNGGANVLGGMRGDDLIDGLGGDDRLAGGDGADGIRGRQDHDTLLGGAGADDLRGNQGNDRLVGNAGADVLRGGKNADDLLGGRGGDVLAGNRGADRLDGGRGSDTLSGGSGADMFVIGPRAGDDVVTDFAVATDLVDMTALDIAFADLQIGPAGGGEDTRIVHPEGTLLLRDVAAATVSADSFLFAGDTVTGEDLLLLP